MRMIRTGAPMVWLALCLLVVAAAETGRPGGVDLIGPTFSELVFTERGARLVGVAMMAAAVAAASAGRALLELGAPVDRWSMLLLGVWTGAMTVAAVVPMTPVGAPFAWHDQVHRWVALAGLVCLPLAGLRLSRAFAAAAGWRALSRPLRYAARAGLVTLATFVLASVQFTAYRGVTERATLAADLVIIALLSAAARRSAATPLTLTAAGRPTSGRPGGNPARR